MLILKQHHVSSILIGLHNLRLQLIRKDNYNHEIVFIWEVFAVKTTVQVCVVYVVLLLEGVGVYLGLFFYKLFIGIHLISYLETVRE